MHLSYRKVSISIDTSHYMKTLKQYWETLKKHWKKTERFWNNFRNILEDKYWKKPKKKWTIFRRILEVSTVQTITEILRKVLKFLNDFVELFRILMLGNNVTWKLQGNSRLILRKLWINIGVTLNIINFAEVVKKILKTFLEILMKFVEKCRDPL